MFGQLKLLIILLTGGHEKATLGGLYNHHFMVDADNFIPFTEEFVPINEIRPVSDQPNEECSDFRTFKRLGDVIPKCHGGDLNGYTMAFVLNESATKPDLKQLR